VPSREWLSSLAVLLQNGVAAWLLGGPVREAGPEKNGPISISFDWLPGSQRETTMLLAEMILPQLFHQTPGIQ
jgi:hypothetical protein